MLRRRAAVLGSPIAHSLSPVLHRAAYRALDLDWSYEAIEVTAAGLPGFLNALDGSWAGLSLTMPLKEAVIPLLDDISPLAAATRSVNTVVFGGTGRDGHNTDVGGMVTAVQAAVPDAAIQTATIIGAGATARSAAAAAAELGAQRVVVVARRPEAAAEVLACARELSVASAEVRPWVAVGDALTNDLVVAAVPGDAAAALSTSMPARPRVLLDVTYHPWPTALASAWTAAGGVAVPGSAMLLWQAAEQVRLMTGQEPPVTAMAEALRRTSAIG